MNTVTTKSLAWAVLGAMLGAGGTYLVMCASAGERETTRAPTTAPPGRAVSATEPAKPGMSPAEMAASLRKGGFILYFRHAQRQKWDSVVAFDIYELAKGDSLPDAAVRDAVCLSGQGREEAKMIGKVFELANIPIGTVASSPICRARQTAELAFGHVDLLSAGLAHTPITNTGNADSFANELKRMLATIPVPIGKNSVITGHANTIENHKALFSHGTELFNSALVGETGFYVLRRDADGKLSVIFKYQNIGEFAASAINLPASVALGPK